MKIFCSFSLLFFSILVSAQQQYEVKSYEACPEAFQYLLLSNEEIAKNDTINEQIVDLVEPMLLDSMISRKKQHHKLGPLGWTIHAFGGFNWRAMYMQKEKVVGSVMRISRSGKERFTEYDINFDLQFHLPKYLYRVFKSYDRQAKIKRQDITSKRKRDYKAPPFVRDTNNIDSRMYRLHCELTPQREFRPALNYLFYPTLPEAGGLGQHPNFEEEEPTVGFYGVICLDCNHSCHPEMHPYEWMWWLKAKKQDSSTVKEWHIGIFHESSNRLKNWSKNPMIGKIKIPFAFKSGKQSKIVIKHGVMGQFLEEDGLDQLEYEENNFQSDKTERYIELKGQELSEKIKLEVINPIRTEGLKYWISGLNYDQEKQIISGFLYYAVAVEDLYTTSIQFHP